MIQKDLNWTSKDGLRFFAHTWQPDGTPKAVITLVHGLGEHCLRYTPYFELFVKEGFAILGFDVRGHGQTEGKRGTIASYNALLNDIDTALQKTKELFADTPQFIYGHSMGGNLALNYLLRRQPDIKGGIITSPWLALADEPNIVLKALVSALKSVIPNATIDSGLKIEHISTIGNEVEKYRNDPLNHGRISFRLFNEIANSGLWAIKNSHKLKTPTLILHGTDDKITSAQASKQAAENNKEKIELIEWDKCYHELHNDIKRQEVAQAVIDWINKHL